MLCVDDDRRLLDCRESLFDSVGKHGTGEGAELAEVAAGPFPTCQCDQQRGLARRVAQGSEDLPARATPARVDGRAEKHNRPDALRLSLRQLGDDLTAH